MDSKVATQSEELPAAGLYKRARTSRRRRLLRPVGLAALLVWLGARYFGLVFPAIVNESDEPLLWPDPPDMSVDACAAWSVVEFSGTASARFELPVDSDAQFLIWRGVPGFDTRDLFWPGDVHYSQSKEVSDSIRVDITAWFRDEDELNNAKACPVSRAGDERGAGIFTRWDGREWGEQKLRFDVFVTFPQTSDGSPLPINHLWTDVQSFSQSFGNKSNVAFNRLAVQASVGGIDVQALSAQERIRPAQPHHLRRAHPRRRLPPEWSQQPDGGLDALDLRSSGAAFRVAAQTRNAPLDLRVHTAPRDAAIGLWATTTVGAVNVKLPSTYEGAFDAATSRSMVMVAQYDWAGRAPPMVYEERQWSYVRGSVAWEGCAGRRPCGRRWRLWFWSWEQLLLYSWPLSTPPAPRKLKHAAEPPPTAELLNVALRARDAR
ncbi:hypothetical protein B0H14DRAFT_3543822 [Mycena olivaceomarginata]|nr:hypothetical protein B0H14DRAFT_3543822 [Mycena olivaceomarginata]